MFNDKPIDVSNCKKCYVDGKLVNFAFVLGIEPDDHCDCLMRAIYFRGTQWIIWIPVHKHGNYDYAPDSSEAA